MLSPPEMVILVVGATRMYHALSLHYTDLVEYEYKWHSYIQPYLTFIFAAQVFRTNGAPEVRMAWAKTIYPCRSTAFDDSL